eukprot:g39295.t1
MCCCCIVWKLLDTDVIQSKYICHEGLLLKELWILIKELKSYGREKESNLELLLQRVVTLLRSDQKAIKYESRIRPFSPSDLSTIRA